MGSKLGLSLGLSKGRGTEIKLPTLCKESQFYYLRYINFIIVAFLCSVLKPGGVEKLLVSDFPQVPTCFVFNCPVVERINFHFDAPRDSGADCLGGSGEHGRAHTAELLLETRCNLLWQLLGLAELIGAVPVGWQCLCW